MSGLLNMLRNIVGVYAPNTYQVPFEQADGTLIYYDMIPSGIGSVNIEYLFMCAVYALTLYFIYKAVLLSLSPLFRTKRKI